MERNGLIRPEVLDLVKSWCEWTGKRAEDFVNEALLEKVKDLADGVADFDVPRAVEFRKKALNMLAHRL